MTTIESKLTTYPSLTVKNDSVQNIIEYVCKNGFNEFTTISEMERHVKESYFNKIKQVKGLIYELNSFDFFNQDYYNFTNFESNNYYLYQMILYKFKNIIIEYIESSETEATDPLYFALPKSPSIQAFMKRGHNILDIEPSGKDYGLLFE